jgi:hypothetical protein
MCVRLKKFAADTGYSEKAIRQKIEDRRCATICSSRYGRVAYKRARLADMGTGSVAIRRCGVIGANETNDMTDEADLDSGLGPHI